MLPKPLCISNKPSPARLLWSASSLPRTRVRAAPAACFAPTPWDRGAVGSPGFCRSDSAAPDPPQPRHGVWGCPGSPVLSGCKPTAGGRAHGWVLPPRVRVSGALWGALRSPTIQCPTHLVQTHGAPKPATPVPKPSPASSVSKGEGMGGLSPKAATWRVSPKAATWGQPRGVVGVGTSPPRCGRAGAGESSALLALARGHGAGRSSRSPPPRQREFRHEK